MKTTQQIAAKVLSKTATGLDAETIAAAIANNADDVIMSLIRRRQRQLQNKQAGIIPDELAKNYFFANPYGLDFNTWAGMQDINEGEEEVPTESMPDLEETETPYDYVPNPQESTEPIVSPESPMPIPKGKVKKTAALLQMVAKTELTKHGLLKTSKEDNKPLIRKKVEEFLRKYSTDLITGGLADGKPKSEYDPKQLAMGQKVEKEHTTDLRKATEIAEDHLEEFPNYYTALDRMEKSLEEKKKEAADSSTLRYDLTYPYEDPLSKLPLYTSLGAGSQGLGMGMNKAFHKEVGGYKAILNPSKLLKHIKKMPMSSHAKILGMGLLGGGLAAGTGFLGGKFLEKKIRENAAKERGKKLAAVKFGLDAAELLGQEEQRKNELHQQQLQHNEENHTLEMQKKQLELQQYQETYQLKQQQQAQKNQEQMAQQQMMQQMQAQQQQEMRQQQMANLAGGGGQQPPQQGMQASR